MAPIMNRPRGGSSHLTHLVHVTRTTVSDSARDRRDMVLQWIIKCSVPVAVWHSLAGLDFWPCCPLERGQRHERWAISTKVMPVPPLVMRYRRPVLRQDAVSRGALVAKPTSKGKLLCDSGLTKDYDARGPDPADGPDKMGGISTQPQIRALRVRASSGKTSNERPLELRAGHTKSWLQLGREVVGFA